MPASSASCAVRPDTWVLRRYVNRSARVLPTAPGVSNIGVRFAARITSLEQPARSGVAVSPLRSVRAPRARAARHLWNGAGAAKPESYAVDPYLVAGKMTADSTLAYHTALEFHGKAHSMHPGFTSEDAG